MVEYKCSECRKIFYKKSHYEDHLNRINPCDRKKENRKLKCEYCNKSYARKDTLNRHINTIHANIIEQEKIINADHHDQNNYNNDVIINNNYIAPDLLKICDELKKYSPETGVDNIETKIVAMKNYIRSESEIDFQAKKKFIVSIKNIMYNHSDLIKESAEKNKIILDLKRELAKNLLQQIDEIPGTECESIIKLINTTTDVNKINIILRLINKAYCFGSEINNSIIENQIEKEADIDEFLFGDQ